MKKLTIAGVSVNPNALPQRQELIDSAKETPLYKENKNADKLIAEEIKKSGLYPTDNSKPATAIPKK